MSLPFNKPWVDFFEKALRRNSFPASLSFSTLDIGRSIDLSEQKFYIRSLSKRVLGKRFLMESEDHLQQQRIARFWKRYVRELRLCQVPDTALPWYRKHVQAFIDFAPHTRLADRPPETLQQWFTTPTQRALVRDWQQRQRVDALRLLYCLVVKTEWAARFDWEAWADPRRLPMAVETTKFDQTHFHYAPRPLNNPLVRPAVSR